jgi:hypothetical protein
MRAGWGSIAATLALMIAAAVTGYVGPRGIDWLPGRFEKPVLALELAQTPAAFNRMIEEFELEPPHDVAKTGFRHNTWADFALIAAYAITWVLVLRQRSGLFFTLGAAAILIAAGSDLAEDVQILRGLDSAGSTAASVTWAALAKWGALGAGFAVVAYRFWPDKEVRDGWQLWSAAIAALYGYSSALCLIGVAFSHPVIERVGLPLTIALFMQLVLFWHERHAAT